MVAFLSCGAPGMPWGSEGEEGQSGQSRALSSEPLALPSCLASSLLSSLVLCGKNFSKAYRFQSSLHQEYLTISVCFCFNVEKRAGARPWARMGRRFARMTASPVAGRESAAFVSARCHESCLSPAAAWRCRGEPRAGGHQQGLVNAQTWGTPRLCVTLAAAGGAQRSLHPQAAFRAGVSGRLAGRRG